MEVCSDLRERSIRTPILMLTARGQTADKVTASSWGPMIIFTKPFETAELLARVVALLRRASQPPYAAGSVYKIGAMQVDFLKTEVLRDGKPVPLSAKEFKLLRYFIEHRGETLSRERLLSEVWGYDVAPSTRTVDVHVAWLRQKLESDPSQPELILTMHGLGYQFAA